MNEVINNLLKHTLQMGASLNETLAAKAKNLDFHVDFYRRVCQAQGATMPFMTVISGGNKLSFSDMSPFFIDDETKQVLFSIAPELAKRSSANAVYMFVPANSYEVRADDPRVEQVMRGEIEASEIATPLDIVVATAHRPGVPPHSLIYKDHGNGVFSPDYTDMADDGSAFHAIEFFPPRGLSA